MKKIIYYITDHGKGHATRSIAIIRELLRRKFEVTIRNTNSFELLQKALPKTSIITGKTDVGTTTHNNGIFIDEKLSKTAIQTWLAKSEYYLELELNRINSLKPDLIISDISIMPLLVANKLDVKSIAISNFTWYDVLKFLTKDELTFMKNAYDFADLAIKLPIGTDMKHFKNKKNVGTVARVPTKTKMELRKQFGIKNNELVVTFALGGKNIDIKSTFGKDIRVFSMNTKISNSINFSDFSQWTEGQEIILASDLVICKTGYGLISECVTSGTKFCHVFDENHVEQVAMSKYLKKLGIDSRISLDEINNTHFDIDFIRNKQDIVKDTNDVTNVEKIVSEFLKN